MTAITICSLRELPHALRPGRLNPAVDLVVSITDPKSPSEEDATRFLDTLGVPVFRLAFHDLDRIVHGHTAPSLPAYRDMLAGIDRAFPPEGPAPAHVLVHCHAGMSRSPATAMVVLAHLAAKRSTPAAEAVASAVARVKIAAPLALPNRRIASIGDHLLDVEDYDGTLERACEAIHEAARSKENGFVIPSTVF